MRSPLRAAVVQAPVGLRSASAVRSFHDAGMSVDLSDVLQTELCGRHASALVATTTVSCIKIRVTKSETHCVKVAIQKMAKNAGRCLTQFRRSLRRHPRNRRRHGARSKPTHRGSEGKDQGNEQK